MSEQTSGGAGVRRSGWITLCGDHWQESNPTEYLPNVTREGTCEVCGDVGLVYGMRRTEYVSGEAGDSGRYVAGWNMAGYLPETDPETFDTLDEAYAYLHETLEQWLEQDEQPETMTAAGILERGADYVDGWYDRNNLHLWAQRIEDWRIVPPIWSVSPQP